MDRAEIEAIRERAKVAVDEMQPPDTGTALEDYANDVPRLLGHIDRLHEALEAIALSGGGTMDGRDAAKFAADTLF